MDDAMLEIRRKLEERAEPTARLVLTFDARQRSRQRARLDDGRDVGLWLPRGTVLRGGDRLEAEDGTVVLVEAAPELLSTVRSDDPKALLRAAYHLGNRHVPVQIGEGWVRYEHDHVLDDMVRGLGLAVDEERAGFEPEAGAYGAHAHGHAHGHDHAHGHEHTHGHAHE